MAILASIWTRPRATIRAVLDGPHPMRGVWFLAGLGGSTEILSNAAINAPLVLAFLGVFKNPAELMEHPRAILIFLGLMVVLGTLFGCLRLWVGSFFLAWTGKWLDGKATRRQIMPAMAWPQVIFIPASCLFAAPMILLMFGVLNEQVFDIWMPLGSLTGITGIIWGLIVYLKCLGEAQGFSAWLAFANTILAAVIGFFLLIIPLGILAVVIVPILMNLLF